MKTKSVMGKFIGGILFPLLIILVITSIILTTRIGNSVSEVQQENLSSEASSAANLVDEYFERYFTLLEVSAKIPILQDIVQEVHMDNKSFTLSEAYNESVTMLKDIQNMDSEVLQAVYVADFKTSQALISDNSTMGYNDGWDITTRPYYQLVSSKNKTITTPAYKDDATGGIVVTIATPLYSKNGSEML